MILRIATFAQIFGYTKQATKKIIVINQETKIIPCPLPDYFRGKCFEPRLLRTF